VTGLAIRIGDHEVGRLELIAGTSRFSLSETYKKSIQRPTLGQTFLDDPDTRRARLAPAYDLVPTRLFVKSDGFALKLGGSNKWRDLRRSSFESIAGALGRQPQEVLDWVDDAALHIRAAWTNIRSELPLTQGERGEIEACWNEIPLLRSA